MKNKRNKRGFTIVELVITIAVIGILSAILIPTFISLNSKANKASDSTLVYQLNQQLEMRKADPKDTENKTMFDAVMDLEKQGYLLEVIVNKSEDKILYSIEDNKFLFESEKDTGRADIEYWQICNSMPETQQYSIYAGEEWDVKNVTGLKVGFDAGRHDEIESVELDRSASEIVASTKLVVHTNSLTTSLSLNCPKDHVYRAGKARIVEPLVTANNSFEDHGYTPWITLNDGRYVVTADSKVDTLYLNVDKTNSEQKLSITVTAGAEMPEIARPALALGAEEVVEIVEVTTEQASGADTTEIYYLQGSATIEGGDVLVSTDNGATKTAVEVETASETAQAIANIKVNDEVQETGYTVEEKEDAAEAVINDAQTAEVQEQAEQAQEDFSMYEARIGLKGFTKLADAYNAAASGDEIVILKDIILNKRFSIQKSITVNGLASDGTTHKMEVLKNTDSRVIDIADNADLTVNLKNLTISAPSSERGISAYNARNLKLNISKCNINASLYAINFASLTSIDVTIKDSTVTGWAALNIWSDGVAISVKRSTLIGLNDKTYNAEGWNNFSTICFEGDSTHQTTMHSSEMNVVCEDSTIVARSTTGNRQTIVGFNPQCLNNKIAFNNCEFVYGDETLNSLFYNGGTNDSLTVDGVEKLINISVDATGLIIEEDGITATGTIVVSLGNLSKTLNLEEAADVSYWEGTSGNGNDYFFYDVVIGETTFDYLDLDISAAYGEIGFHLYYSVDVNGIH